jgi:hypothetical protein
LNFARRLTSNLFLQLPYLSTEWWLRYIRFGRRMGEIEGAGLAAAVCDLVSVLFSGLSIEENLALDPSLALEKVANFTRMLRAFDESNSAAQAHYRGDDASRIARSRKKVQGGPLPKHRRHLECQQAIFPQRGRRHWARGRPKTGRASMMASTILLCYDVGKAASVAHFMRWSKPAELEPSRSRALRERYLIGS